MIKIIKKFIPKIIKSFNILFVFYDLYSHVYTFLMITKCCAIREFY